MDSNSLVHSDDLQDERNESNSQKHSEFSKEQMELLGREYFTICVFFGVIFGGFFSCKCLCFFGLPNDCHANSHDWLMWHEIWNLLTYGFILLWFIDIRLEERQKHFLNFRKRWYFYCIFFLAILVYAGLQSLPIFEIGLDSDSNFGPGVIIALIAVSGFIGVLGWHYYHAWTRFGYTLPFKLYIGRTAGTLTFYAIYLLSQVENIASDTTNISIHVHHWWIGWMMSTFCIHNHWISDIFFAITLSIFVSGISDYDIADLVEGASCVRIGKRHPAVDFTCYAQDTGVEADVCWMSGNVDCWERWAAPY